MLPNGQSSAGLLVLYKETSEHQGGFPSPHPALRKHAAHDAQAQGLPLVLLGKGKARAEPVLVWAGGREAGHAV